MDLAISGGNAQMNNELRIQNNVAAVRKDKGLSQLELAKLVGVSRNTISSIKTGLSSVFLPIEKSSVRVVPRSAFI